MLDRLAGNAGVKAALSAALAAGRLPQSVLLAGEDGCGAGFAARCLAADHLYPGGGSGAQQVMDSRSPECIELRRAGAGGQIRIDPVRQALSAMAATALSAGGRALLLYHAEDLNPNSANTLLKSLEEPPEGALFVLTACSPARVLPTIRSRCAEYTLSPVSPEECAAALPEAPRAQVLRLGEIYGGRIGLCRQAASGHRRASLERAETLAALAAAGDEYGVLTLLSGCEKDELLLLLEDLRCLTGAALRRPGLCPLEGAPAAHAARQAGAAMAALRANGNVKLAAAAFCARLFTPA